MANHTKQLNNTVSLSKREYLRLRQESLAYRKIAAKIFEIPLRDSVGEAVADFRAANLYTNEFLADLGDGLRKSSYGKKHAN